MIKMITRIPKVMEPPRMPGKGFSAAVRKRKKNKFIVMGISPPIRTPL